MRLPGVRHQQRILGRLATLFAVALCGVTFTTRTAAAEATDGAPQAAATDGGAEGGEPPPPAPTPSPRSLRIAVAGSEPFVVRDGEELDGFVVDMWLRLQDEVPALENASLAPFANVEAALRAVRTGKADIALGPISITAERAEHLSFSQPFYITSLAILAPATQSLWAKLAPFATRAFGAGLALLMLVLGGVGTLLWLSERRANPSSFPRDPVAGIGNGIWLALVTMTTVGYGDLAPVTRRGRIVAGAWMVIAMLTASSLTASIATALTLSQLETPGISSVSDLRDKSVAALSPSPAAKIVRNAGGRLVPVRTPEEGIEAVEVERADAVVWDKPVLAHFIHEHPESELSLSPATFQTRGYGMAVRHDDDLLLRDVDLGILRLMEDGELEALEQRWLAN